MLNLLDAAPMGRLPMMVIIGVLGACALVALIIGVIIYIRKTRK